MLHLPAIGYKVLLQPGDVIAFLAEQQLHKLEVDPEGPQTEARQVIFTIWTDSHAQDLMAQGFNVV